jgi:protein-S-isoprenylcysteine O-methyltransferase Ste14
MPGSAAVYVPWLILTAAGGLPKPVVWAAVAPIGLGLALYVACLWAFATVGRGTPGPWDAPRTFVAVGPYRWVRNPMYVAVLLVVAGEALLFLSVALAAWAAVLGTAFHLFVTGYEEPSLAERFGASYERYRQSVPRWIPVPRRVQ